MITDENGNEVVVEETANETVVTEPTTEAPAEDAIKDKKKRLSMVALGGFEEVGFTIPEQEDEDEPKETEPKEETDDGKKLPEGEKPEEGEQEKLPKEKELNLKGVKITTRKKQEKPKESAQLTKEEIEEAVRKAIPKASEPTKAEDNDDDLPESVKDEIALWKYGEEEGLAEKGTGEKIRAFVKGRAKLVERLVRENKSDPDYELEQDREYREYMRENKPKLDEGLKRKIERAQIIKEAEERAEKKARAERLKLEEEMHRIKTMPKVETTLSNFSKEVETEVLPEKTDDNEHEVSLAEKIVTQTKRVATEFLNLRNGLTPYDGKNKYHDFIYRFVDAQANSMLKNPAQWARDGQPFVHPFDSEGKEGWTFSDEDVLSLLKRKAKADVDKKISDENARIQRIIEKRGLAPAQKQEKPKTENNDETEGKSPSVKPSVNKGSSENKGGKPTGLFTGLFGGD